MSWLTDFLQQLIQLEQLLARQKPAKIYLPLPVITRKGKIMPNYELKNDTVATIPIQTTNSLGTVEPVPAGDVFSAVSSNVASLGAAISKDASSNPTLVLTPMVQASPNISVTVSDSAGLVVAMQLVDIVMDNTDTNIILDLSGATMTPQAVPTAPGP